jgi:prepilin-type N-terminal cleavage/methylation domain-containing protein
MRTIPVFARRVLPASRGTRAQRGFSLIELLVVMVMMGILMSIALPRFGAIRDRAAVSSTKQKLMGYLATTRAAAIRQSSTAEFRIWDNDVSATVTQPNGSKLSLGSAEHLDKTEGVVITRGTGVARDLITYDSRGLSLIGTVTT